MIPFGIHCATISLVSHNKVGAFIRDINHTEWGIDLAPKPRNHVAAGIADEVWRVLNEIDRDRAGVRGAILSSIGSVTQRRALMGSTHGDSRQAIARSPAPPTPRARCAGAQRYRRGAAVAARAHGAEHAALRRRDRGACARVCACAVRRDRAKELPVTERGTGRAVTAQALGWPCDLYCTTPLAPARRRSGRVGSRVL